MSSPVVLLVTLLLSWVMLARGDVYECRDCFISPQLPVVNLETYGFDTGGQLELSFANLVYESSESNISDLNNVYFYIIPESSTSLFEHAVSDSGGNYCNLRSFLSPTFNASLADILDNHNVEAKRYPALPQVQYRFTQPAVYQMFLMHCGNRSLSLNLVMKRFNVDSDDHVTHLELGYTDTPLVYQVFGFYIWPVVVVLWGINYFYYREQGVQALHLFLGFVNLSGWDITRTYLTLAEWRAVVGIGAFVALADTYYIITKTAALFTLLVLHTTKWFYLFGNFTHVASVLTLYTERLASQLSESNLLHDPPSTRLTSGVSMGDSRATSMTNSPAQRSTRASSVDPRVSVARTTMSASRARMQPTGEHILQCYLAKLTMLREVSQFILLTVFFQIAITLLGHFLLLETRFSVFVGLSEGITLIQLGVLNFWLRARVGEKLAVPYPSIHGIRVETFAASLAAPILTLSLPQWWSLPQWTFWRRTPVTVDWHLQALHLTSPSPQRSVPP
ncbi:hypothetical protein IWQ62_000004 [Dispira parvispora]|uniref:Intimal thickness related receptor IRP domain-containing protein n=1 Tax=Dispira parvispora TaxID=1520584 RepID=A0A9W8EAK5_9FUNG|nr:hypothetical protein IWQ62_000004 [Dispira parvispora]